MADRRRFLQQAGLGVAAAATGAVSPREAPAQAQAVARCDDLPRQGPKEVVRGKKSVAASQHPIVTQTMLDVLRAGGNAADAAVAGCITQATVQPDDRIGNRDHQIIEERRRQFFLDGHRNYDRIRFNLPLDPPTDSPYRWGGNHGSAKCLPLPDVERLNNENIP